MSEGAGSPSLHKRAAPSSQQAGNDRAYGGVAPSAANGMRKTPAHTCNAAPHGGSKGRGDSSDQGAQAEGNGMEPAGPPSPEQQQQQQQRRQDGLFLDEEAEMARHPFPIPPAELIERAREVLAAGVHRWPDLAQDFEFTAPFMGPLGPESFRSTMATLALEEAFPDMAPRYHHLRVDPFNPARVWFTLRPRCTHLGKFKGKLPKGVEPTGRVIEEPPQTSSLTFNAAGEVVRYTMGYIMDRAVGNTDGLGGAFGLMWALGVPLPAPEGRPWSPSLQLRLFNSGNALAQALVYLWDRATSLLLPSWLLTMHSRNTM